MLHLTSRASELFLHQSALDQRRLLETVLEKAARKGCCCRRPYSNCLTSCAARTRKVIERKGEHWLPTRIGHLVNRCAFCKLLILVPPGRPLVHNVPMGSLKLVHVPACENGLGAPLSCVRRSHGGLVTDFHESEAHRLGVRNQKDATCKVRRMVNSVID